MLLDEQRITLLLAATAVDLEANGGLQLAEVRAALSLLVDLMQAVEAVDSCQCSGDHFDRDGGGLAVQDAIHEVRRTCARRGVRFGPPVASRFPPR